MKRVPLRPVTPHITEPYDPAWLPALPTIAESTPWPHLEVARPHRRILARGGGYFLAPIGAERDPAATQMHLAMAPRLADAPIQASRLMVYGGEGMGLAGPVPSIPSATTMTSYTAEEAITVYAPEDEEEEDEAYIDPQGPSSFLDRWPGLVELLWLLHTPRKELQHYQSQTKYLVIILLYYALFISGSAVLWLISSPATILTIKTINGILNLVAIWFLIFSLWFARKVQLDTNADTWHRYFARFIWNFGYVLFCLQITAWILFSIYSTN